MGEDSSVFAARQAMETPEAPLPVLPAEEPLPETDMPEAAQEALAWMETLAAKQGAPAEQLSVPETERPVEPPEWVKGAIVPPSEAVTQISIQRPARSKPMGTGPLTPAGRVDLNRATLSQLEHLPNVGFVLAQRILEYRDVNGPFVRVEDLANVSGITPEFALELSLFVEVMPVAPTPVPTPEKAAQPAPAALKATDNATLLNARRAVIANDISRAMQAYASLIHQRTLLEDVIQDLQEALKNQPADINLWQTLGDAYVRNDQLQEAMDAYTRAEELLR
jgi:competence ComEA-like helix-hairpin-helix protein